MGLCLKNHNIGIPKITKNLECAWERERERAYSFGKREKPPTEFEWRHKNKLPSNPWLQQYNVKHAVEKKNSPPTSTCVENELFTLFLMCCYSNVEALWEQMDKFNYFCSFLHKTRPIIFQMNFRASGGSLYMFETSG